MNKEQQKLDQISIKETRREILEILRTQHDLLVSHGISQPSARDSNFVTGLGALSVVVASILGNEFGWDFDIDDGAEVEGRYVTICTLIANRLAADMRKFRDMTKDNQDPATIVGNMIEQLKKGVRNND